MRPLPTDPMGQYNRWFAALLDDFAETGMRLSETPRADRVAEIARQQRMKEPQA